LINKEGKDSEVKYSIRLIALAIMAAALAAPAHAQNNLIFKLGPTGGIQSCIPGAKGRVTVTAVAGAENMHVEVSGLPKNTDFDLFVIQVPNSPFGMSWYVSDMTTDANGLSVGDFVGKFNHETFTVAPGVAPAPLTEPTDASSNPITAPIQMYHVGLWFDRPVDAVAAGCAGATTPFNGTHNAGVQILNSFDPAHPNALGPLFRAP
jgi:hypothetical protein